MHNCDIAVYGLGVMGSGLAENMIRHGFWTAVYSKDEGERNRFAAARNEENCVVCADEAELIKALKRPVIVFLMVTAGSAVDEVTEKLLPYMEKGSILIDGGNSHYKDTARRYGQLKARGIHYVGAGVSGGEKGARSGPCVMAGGSARGFWASRRILETISAHCGEEPCCAYVGPSGAGHYVKMVHNGIEYAVLQLLAESYFLMKRGLHLSHGEITEAFKGWKASLLGSYLLDSSIRVLEKKDRDGLPLVEKILDFGQQKGTGKWTLEDALERDVYIPTIFEAVYARSFSADRNLRKRGCERLKSSGMPYEMENYEEKLRDALLLGIISSYAQGMTLIAKASEDSGWDMDMGVLASIWRGGCVIRSDLLPQVGQALTEQEENLLLTDTFSGIKGLEPALREVVTKAQSAAIAVPAFTSVLNYYDYLHMEQLPVNFVQALRDCFGAHTYQRVDQDGWFHTEWE